MSRSSADNRDRHLGASGDMPVPPDETRVIAVLKEYVQQLEAGKAPDRQALLLQHPDIAARLAEYLAGLEFLHGAARPVIDDAQAEAPPAAADQRTDAPRTLGDFTILREIGRGGMGTVYEATQVSLGRRVAIKILPFAAVLDTKYLERFKNEVSAAASLDHPGIVAVYAVGCERGIHFYAMQLIDGNSLTEVIAELRRARDGRSEGPVAGHRSPDGVPDSADETPRPEDHETIRDSATLAGITTEASTRTAEFFRSVARLGVQAAEALDFAHERGIVHRDIKPSNLLVDRNARISIADFGLALTKTTADLTMTGDLVGTLRYMSPEQAAGDRRRLDHRTDVYSLGATLYELVTLRPLFTATDQQRLLHDIAERDPPRPRQINPSVPRDLETVLLKAIAKDRDDRYVSADEMAKDLKRFLANRPVQARRVGAAGRVWRWSKRNPILAGVSAALLLSLLTGTAVSLRFGLQARHEAAVAKARFEQRERVLSGLQMARADSLRKQSPERAREVLDDPALCPPHLRDFPWGYLRWACNRNRLTLQGHAGPVHDVAFTPDGKTIVSAGSDGFVRLWDAVLGKGIRSFRAHRTPVHAVAVSPDGETLATGGEDKSVRLWNLATGRAERSIEVDQDTITAMAFLPNGTAIASYGAGQVVLWDPKSGTRMGDYKADCWEKDCFAVVPNGQLAAVCPPDSGQGHEVHVIDLQNAVDTNLREHQKWVVPADPKSIAWSPDGRFIATCGGDAPDIRGDMWIWDRTKREVRWTITDGRGSLTGLRFTPDGYRLAAAAEDGTIRVWALGAADTWREPLDLAGHDGPIERIAISPDGDWLATAGVDGVVKVWDLRTDGAYLRLAGHDGSVNTVAVSPDGSIAASGGNDRTIRLWDLESGKTLTTLEGHEARVWRLAFSPTEDVLASAGWDGTVRLWDTRSYGLLATLRGHEGRVYAVTFSPDGMTLASGGLDQTVRLWDVRRRAKPRILLGHTERAWCVAFAPDGQTLASSSMDQTVRIWDNRTGNELAALERHKDGVFAVTFSPDGSSLASCGIKDDGTVQIWDVPSFTPSQTLRGHVGAAYSVAFSPDGKTLASAGHDGRIRLWDPVTGVECAVLTGHDDWIYEIAFSPDSRTLVSAGKDSTVGVWRSLDPAAASPAAGDQERQPDRNPMAANGRATLPWIGGIPVVAVDEGVRRTIELGGDSPVYDMVFSPDGEKLVFSRGDGTGQVWSAVTGGHICAMEYGGSPIRDVDISPDGTRIASATESLKVHLWDLRTGSWLRALDLPRRTWAVTFSPQGQCLITAGKKPSVVFVEMTSQERIRGFTHTGFMTRISISPDGKRLATFQEYTKAVQVWDMPVLSELPDLARLSKLRYIPNHSKPVQTSFWRQRHEVTRLAFSPDGSILAAGIDDTNRPLALWDCVQGREIETPGGHDEPVTSLAFLPDGDELLSSSDDGTVRFWDPRSGEARAVLTGNGLHHLALSPDGATLAIAQDADDRIRILLCDMQEIHRLELEAKSARSTDR